MSAGTRRRRIGRPCIDCGRRTTTGSRCPRHAAEHEAARQARQPYRAAYLSEEYRTARAIRLRRAGHRCERILADGSRCPNRATETHHTVELSTARTYEEAIALCRPELLEAVCPGHNPRGPHGPEAAA